MTRTSKLIINTQIFGFYQKKTRRCKNKKKSTPEQRITSCESIIIIAGIYIYVRVCNVHNIHPIRFYSIDKSLVRVSFSWTIKLFRCSIVRPQERTYNNNNNNYKVSHTALMLKIS